MFFDIGWQEIALIGGVALIAIGPKELPGALRTAGQWVGKARRLAQDFQGQFQEEIRKLELEEADPRKHLEPEIAKISADEDLSIQGALNRLSERMKNTIPRDYDA